MRLYELLFIIRPELDEEARGGVVSGAQQAITGNGGEVVRVEDMGRRRLAYPIKHQLEGHYVLIHARMEQQAIRELERYLSLSEDILRYLLVRLEEAEEAGPAEEVAADVEAEE